MRIYRSGGGPRAIAGAWIADVGRALAAARLACDRDAVRAILVEAGELEAAIEDARRPDRDGADALSEALRALVCQAGHALIAARRRQIGAVRRALDKASGALARVGRHALPPVVERRAPEGYSHYGLFPETYEEAAARFAGGRAPGRVVCVGLRSIGTSLAGVVHAALVERGFDVRSLTLRPRGHPFDRRPRLDPQLTAALAREAQTGAHFIVVDEGPGLSGSSLLGAAAALGELGAPDARIALFPSHVPDGRSLRAAGWTRYAKYTGAFESAFDPGSLLEMCDADSIADISAGRWRDVMAWNPPVHLQHERRKFLARDAKGRPIAIFRFAGFGRHGAIRRARAEALANAGFGPPVLGLRDGFLGLRFVDGAPVRPALDWPDSQDLPDSIGRYVAYCARTFVAGAAADPDALREMAEENIADCLGAKWRDRAGRHFDAMARAAAPAVILDGRMAAHEWIRTPGGFVKVDSIDHGLDHFEPGPQDIAWDLAGAAVELDLDESGREALLGRFCAAGGDPGVAQRLPAVEIAYRAFRLAYCTQSARTLAATPEGPRFAALAADHAAALRRLL